MLELLFIAITVYIALTPSGDERGGLSLVSGIFFYIPWIIIYTITLVWYFIHFLSRRKVLSSDNKRYFKIFWFQFFILLIISALTIS